MIVESGLPTPVGVEARQAADNENQREAVDLAEQLCQWGQKHAWHTVGAITHRFKFQKDFSKQLTHLAMDAEANGQKVLAGQISDGLTKILHLCDKIDKICRKGCESDDELDELELAKIHAQKAIEQVAELVGKTLTKKKPVHQPKTCPPSSDTPKRREKVVQSPSSIETKKDKPGKLWPTQKKACFIHNKGNIEFFYKEKVEKLPFRQGSQAPLILCGFLTGTQTGKEIKANTSSKSEPSQIIRNINRTINQQLRKIGHQNMGDIDFIQFSEKHGSYALNPAIVEKGEFDRVVAP